MPKSCIDAPSPSPSIPPSAPRSWSAWRARFAKALRSWLKASLGTYIALAFAVRLSAQEAPERVRFLDGKAELCEVVGKDSDGVVLRLAGLPRPLKFAWWQIDPEDAARLRGEGAASPIPGPGDLTVPGVRVRTIEGRTYEGILQPGAPAGQLWIRGPEGRATIALSSVLAREEVRLEMRLVYSAEEIVALLTGRLRPSTAEDYDKLGAELQRAKLEERAAGAFRMAELLRHPEWPEAKICADLARLRERIEDLAVRRAVMLSQEGTLAGDYDAAVAALDEAERAAGAAPEALLAEIRRLRSQVHALRGRAREERLVAEGWRTMEALLKARAMDRALGYAQARAVVEERLLPELIDELRRRFNFTPEDPAAKLAWESRPGDAAFKHSVGEGTWLFLAPDRRSPESWWQGADDAARYRVLKGHFIEKHLQVVRSELKSCSGCGGTGLDGKGAACDACQGLKAHRVLIYR